MMLPTSTPVRNASGVFDGFDDVSPGLRSTSEIKGLPTITVSGASHCMGLMEARQDPK